MNIEEMDYDSLCEYCRIMREDIDKNRWLVGDTALLIETHYGDHTLESFARDIGTNRSTIKNWKRVSRFYPLEIRAKLIESNQNLTYSFYRDALRLESLELASEWLAEVSSNGYTADEAARKLTERLGRKTQQVAEGRVQQWRDFDTYSVITLEVNRDDIEWLKKSETVTIRASK